MNEGFPPPNLQILLIVSPANMRSSVEIQINIRVRDFTNFELYLK